MTRSCPDRNYVSRPRTRSAWASRRGLIVSTTLALVLASLAGFAPTTARAAADNPSDAFTVKPESLAFGKRAVHSTHTETFWVKNKDKSRVRITSVELQGDNAGMFSVDHNCDDAIAVADQCRIDVTFKPTSAGEKQAELRILTSDKSMRTRALTGTGVAGVESKVEVAPKSIAFGRVARNNTSKEHDVTIRNNGPRAVPITSTSLGGPNEHQFAQSNDCPKELGAGKSCTSRVLFKPTSEGEKTATLTVWIGDGLPERKVAITGTGT
jgi:hypothetical protein